MESPGEGERRPRLTTGVTGLDTILSGGLLPGCVYVVAGGPGTGKTVLSSQIAFHRAAQGERVLYVTTFSEANARLVSNLETFAFFEPSLVVKRITLLSAARDLEEGGLERLHELLSREVRRSRATLLVLDTSRDIADVASSPLAYRKFLRELGAVCTLTRCTALLVVPAHPEPGALELFVADGVLELHQTSVGLRDVRALRVAKFRGSTHLSGFHFFTIDARGISVHPRLEAVTLTRELATPPLPGKQGLGIPGLDDMLHGGVPTASMTAVIGAPGTGKTLLGLHLLAEGLRQGQPCLYFGLYETPPRLLKKAEGVGLSLTEPARSGQLALLWHEPTELILDVVAAQVLEAVDRRGIRRLFIDGADGLLQAAAHPERFPTFLAALTNELRARGVTCGIAIESSLAGPGAGIAPVGLSATSENILFLRSLEVRSEQHRLISIIKVRESDYDSSVREFRITSSGIEVASTFESARQVLEEVTPRPSTPESGGSSFPRSGGKSPEGAGGGA